MAKFCHKSYSFLYLIVCIQTCRTEPEVYNIGSETTTVCFAQILGESDISSYGYHYCKHLPVSNRLTFIAPNLRSALCKRMGSIVLVDWTKHRLDCRPKIGIFPVTRLDIEADLRSASFIIEADLLVLKPISTILKPI